MKIGHLENVIKDGIIMVWNVVMKNFVNLLKEKMNIKFNLFIKIE